MSAKKSQGAKRIQEAQEAKSMESLRIAEGIDGSREVRRAQEAAFEAAFQEHWGRVVGVLQGLLGESGIPGEAEDLALETFTGCT